MKYNKRVWLNTPDSHFTGSMVCHDGIVMNQGKPAARYTFVEFSDCHKKSRIHKDDNLEMVDFINKLRTVVEELNNFIEHLEQHEK